MNSVIETELNKDIQDKSSLRYVNPDMLRVGKCHTIWSTVRNYVTDRRRVQLKCKLLTGSYILQENRVVFNQFKWTKPVSCALLHLRLVNIILRNATHLKLIETPSKKKCVIICHTESDLQDAAIFTRLVLDSSAVLNHGTTDQSVILYLN